MGRLARVPFALAHWACASAFGACVLGLVPDWAVAAEASSREAPPAERFPAAIRAANWSEAARALDELLADPLANRPVAAPAGALGPTPALVGPEARNVSGRTTPANDEGRAADGATTRAHHRFARAYVALALRDPGRALAELAGLERELPLLVREIALLRQRARNLELSTQHSPLASRVAEQERLAREYLEVGDTRRARQASDIALVYARHLGPGDEAEARWLRAQVLTRQGYPLVAAADLTWIAKEAVESPLSDQAAASLLALAPARALTKLDSYERAERLSSLGLPERTEAELERMAKAPGPAAPGANPAYLRAWAYYRARRFVEAASWFAVAAGKNLPERFEALYYAGRAHARSGQPEHAISVFSELLADPRGSGWWPQARLRLARAHGQRGDFAAAVAAYDDYLQRHGGVEGAEAARRERATALFAAGHMDRARSELLALARQEGATAQEAALYRELAAAAVLRQSDWEIAVAELREIVTRYPLSVAALAAVARLDDCGIEVNPLPSAPLAPQALSHPDLEVVLPPAASLLFRLGFEEAAGRVLHEQEGLIRRAHWDHATEASCRAYGLVGNGAWRLATSYHADLRELGFAPTPANRWIWECRYPTPFLTLVTNAEAKHGVDRAFLYSIMMNESAFITQARSPVGAQGLMQIMPPTALEIARELGVTESGLQLLEPATSIEFGAYYLRRLLGILGQRPELAAGAYNAGPTAMSAWLQDGGRLEVDLFIARIPYDETRRYVLRVVESLARYQVSFGREPPRLELALPGELERRTEGVPGAQVKL